MTPILWPASVTPFDADGNVDRGDLAKLMAWFRDAGCNGVVLAGTNGEGPSLSAVEKRDLVRAGVELSDGLPVTLGIATPSLHEAKWLASQAGKAGAQHVLLMAPGYFQNCAESAILDWFRVVADAATCPVIAYNFPKYTGFTMTSDFVGRLAEHGNVVGFKDSSGEVANLATYRSAAPAATLLVGDETILPEAMAAGWSGSISGASNVVGNWLSKWLQNPSQERWKLLQTALKTIRKGPQPALNKAVLAALAVISRPDVRLPLTPADPTECLEVLRDRFGTR